MFQHQPGCKPMSPCQPCQAAEFLRQKLTPEDFATLAEILQDTPATLTPSSPLDYLPVSIRIRNALKNNHCITVGDVCELSRKDLLMMPNFGIKSVEELKDALSDAGLRLADVT